MKEQFESRIKAISEEKKIELEQKAKQCKLEIENKEQLKIVNINH